MLAPLKLPESYTKWNHVHGAPYGRNLSVRRLKKIFMSDESLQKLRGPFALQVNNSIRQFEYPWAFDAGKIESGLRVLEIGGGLSGFQFVLASSGCSVVNVDPGMSSVGWPCNQESMEKLNRRFATQVELRNTTIERADLLNDSFDRAFSISVIEHLPEKVAVEVMKNVHRCLKPGGLFVLTSDLFLNVQPFCSRLENEFGRNQNLRTLIDDADWELTSGDRSCLCGFIEFNPDSILCNLEKYLIGFYPALAQCLVLKKR